MSEKLLSEVETEGARSAPGGTTHPAKAGEVRRWSASRKKEVVLRLLRGEPLASLSRELGVEVYRLERWRDRALAGMDAGLKERDNDPAEAKLADANRRIGELTMEIELLRREREARHPFGSRRSPR